jgi:hypothetical protein
LVVWLGKMSIEPKSEKRKRKELLFKWFERLKEWVKRSRWLISEMKLTLNWNIFYARDEILTILYQSQKDRFTLTIANFFSINIFYIENTNHLFK